MNITTMTEELHDQLEFRTRGQSTNKVRRHKRTKRLHSSNLHTHDDDVGAVEKTFKTATVLMFTELVCKYNESHQEFVR